MTDYTDFTFDLLAHDVIPFLKQEWVIQVIKTVIYAESFEALLQTGTTWFLQQFGATYTSQWTTEYNKIFGEYVAGNDCANSSYCVANWLYQLNTLCT